MGQVKESILTTFYSYLGVVIGYVNLLWLLPYALNPDQLGLFKIIQDMALLLVPFAQLGLGNAITRFYPQVKAHAFAFFTMSLLISLIGYIIVCFLFLIFKEHVVNAYAKNSPEVISYLGVVLLILFFSVLNTILEAICRSFLKIAIPSFFRDVLLRVLIFMLAGIYLFQWISFEGMIWGMSLIYMLTLIGLGVYMFKKGFLNLDFNWRQLPNKFNIEFLKYSFITLLGTSGALLISKIDSLMVTSMVGLEANAIYAIGFAMGIVIEMPRRAISQVVMPIVAERFALNQIKEINELYKKVAVNQLIVCLLIFLLIWLNIDNIYFFVPNGDLYATGKWVVLMIGLAKIFDVIFSINGEIIVFSKFYIFNITATLIMCVVTITLNLIFIPFYGIEGAALGSMVAMFLFNIIKYVYIKLRLGFDPFTIDIFKTLILAGIVFILTNYILTEREIVFLDIIIRSGLVILLYLIGIYLLKIAPDEQKIILDKVKAYF